MITKLIDLYCYNENGAYTETIRVKSIHELFNISTLGIEDKNCHVLDEEALVDLLNCNRMTRIKPDKSLLIHPHVTPSFNDGKWIDSKKINEKNPSKALTIHQKLIKLFKKNRNDL